MSSHLQNRKSRSSLLLNTASVAALLSAGLTGSALAQASGNGDVEQVVVTGSRIGTPGFQTPTPVTEISPLQYEVKQLNTLTDIEQDIPSLTPNEQNDANADVAASFFSLRNLGATRTLTMVNGLRTQFTTIDGGYDITVLPASLVQHIDVVTAGASAAYGSDAVAGVVNVTLNTTFQGFQAKFGAGESYYGDDQIQTASLAWGTDIAGGRGHLVLGGDYYHDLGVLAQAARPYGRANWGIVSTPGCTSYTTTCTDLIMTTNVLNGQMTDGGVIVSPGPLAFIQFGPGGVPGPYNTGALHGATYQVGGSGSDDQMDDPLEPPVERATLLAHGDYDLTDDINVWVQMSYARSSQRGAIVPSYDNGNLTITNQNPFIPASVLSMMTANNITQFLMGRTNVDDGPIAEGRNYVYGRNEVYDPSIGIKGKFDALGTDWSWDVNGQYSTHLYNDLTYQNRNNANFALSLDAIANPAVGGVAGVPAGVAICRSTLTAPTNGCVPVDLFGPNSMSSAAIGYFMGTAWTSAILTMQDVSANLKGEPFSTWAGPVSIAVGGEARLQTTSNVSDPTSNALGWKNQNTVGYKGHYSVEEGYLEAGIPLLKDSPIGTSADIDAAVRATSYSTSGGVTTWKVGFNYQPIEDLRIRGTRSHDIRAPDLAELFGAQTSLCCTTIVNPVTGVSAPALAVSSGNPNLKPEIGDTQTAGVVYSPSWLDGFNVSADYWRIKLTKEITSVGGATAVTNCLLLNEPQYCAAISYTGGVISQVVSESFNAASLETDGWDFEAGYNFQASDVMQGWGGTVQLHALATLLGDYISNTTNIGGSIINTAGSVDTASLPRLRSNITAIYLNDPWTITVSGNWVGGGKVSALYNTTKYTYAQGARTINNNSIPGDFLVNVSVSYQVTDAWQIYGKLTDALNTQPSVTPSGGFTFPVATTQYLYGRVGGEFMGGVKLSLN